MPLHPSIQLALNEYNARFITYFKSKHPAIVRIEALSNEEKSDIFTVYECFLSRSPDKKGGAYRVYLSVLDQMYPLHSEEQRALRSESRSRSGEVVFSIDKGLLVLQEEGVRITRDNYNHLMHILSELAIVSIDADGDFFPDFFQLVAKLRQKVRPFTQELFDILCQQETISYRELYELLSVMSNYNAFNKDPIDKKDRLTAEEFRYVMFNPDSSEIISLLLDYSYLSKSLDNGLITQRQFDLYAYHPSIKFLALVTRKIRNNSLCLFSGFDDKKLAVDILAKSNYPAQILPWLAISYEENVKLQATEASQISVFTELYKRKDTTNITKILDWLWISNHKPTQAIFVKFVGSFYSNQAACVAHILCVFVEKDLLFQDNVDRLLNLFKTYNSLISSFGRNEVWGRIPIDMLSQEVFDELFQRALGANPEELLRAYVADLLQLRDALDVMPVFNIEQSTHTASVHRSVSESAIKLKEKYECYLDKNLNNILIDIKRWVFSLPSIVNEHEVAKRCIRRLIHPRNVFEDSLSQVSLMEILALTWVAMHDDKSRIGLLEERKEDGHIDGALGQFIKGLNDIQRGYNTSLQEPDNSICLSGTFNKLVENLWGIHPLVELEYITATHASEKLLIVIKEEVNHYLASISQPTTEDEEQLLKDRLHQIQEEGILVIWELIKPMIVTRMFEEFGSMYKNKDDPRFIELIDAGKDFDVTSLPAFADDFSIHRSSMRT